MHSSCCVTQQSKSLLHFPLAAALSEVACQRGSGDYTIKEIDSAKCHERFKYRGTACNIGRHKTTSITSAGLLVTLQTREEHMSKVHEIVQSAFYTLPSKHWAYM